MDLKKLDDAINTYVRPTSRPIAIRMCSSLKEIPKGAKFPVRDLGLHWPVCMVFTAVARKGWIMGIGLEDQQCPLGNITLGFAKPPEAFLDGSLEWSVIPPGEANAQYSQAIKRLEYGKYKYLLAAPIEKTTFEPHLILIFAMPAQVAKLVQGRLFLTGGTLTSSACLGITCSMQITHTMLTDECQFVLPGSGPRCFGQIQDHEMSFTIPASKVDLVAQGLKESTGIVAYDYPPNTVMQYEFEFPPGYRNLQELLLGRGNVNFRQAEDPESFRRWWEKYNPYCEG